MTKKYDIDATAHEYITHVVPDIEIGSHQYETMKACWWAASSSLFRYMLVDVSELSNEEGSKAIDSIQDDFEKYLEDLTKENT